MDSNHTTSIEIKHGVNTQGFFSFEEPDALVVFVHGFGGNALTTWLNFPTILLFDEALKKKDIVYYGYDTFKGQAGDHAAQLFHFLNLLVTPLESGILPSNQNLPERNYKRIILVAHSLGAVLVRQAQLLAFIDKKKWVDNSEIALFAPAHHGANIIPLAMQALPGLSGLLGLFAKFRFPILNDLDPEDDGIVKSIKKLTEDLQNQGKAEFSKARLVVYAKGDKVVRDFPYCFDKPPIVIEGATHISVCKPRNAMQQPVQLLKSIF